MMLLAIAGTVRLKAAVYEAKNLGRITSEADQIVQGKIIQCTATREKQGRIWTTYTVQVQEMLKSLKKDAKPAFYQVSIKQLGGKVGSITCKAFDVPHFVRDEEVLLFTRDFGAGW
jgi:hypothetical protein